MATIHPYIGPLTSDDICPIFREPLTEKNTVITSCGHLFSRNGLKSWLIKVETSWKISPHCPTCRNLLNSNDLVTSREKICARLSRVFPFFRYSQTALRHKFEAFTVLGIISYVVSASSKEKISVLGSDVELSYYPLRFSLFALSSLTVYCSYYYYFNPESLEGSRIRSELRTLNESLEVLKQSLGNVGNRLEAELARLLQAEPLGPDLPAMELQRDF